MNLKNRMAGIDANLDDLQSGIEASLRTTNALHINATKLNGQLGASRLRSVLQHVKDLQAYARDQRAALQELRDSIKGLQQELKRSEGVVRPLGVASGQQR